MKWNVTVMMLCASLVWSGSAMAETPQSSDESDRNTVEGLAVEEGEDGTHIRIQGTREATFSVFTLDEPPRLFVDLSNSELADGELSQEVYNGVISEVGIVEYEDGFQDVARLVVGFEEAAHYDVNTDDEDVVVFIDGEQRTGGEDPVAQQREELQEREQQLEAAQQQLDTTQDEHQRQLQQRQQDYEDAQAQLEDTRQQLEDTEQQLQQLRQERDDASGEERQRLEASIAEQNEQLEAAEQRLQQREQRVEQMQASIERLEEERNELEAERDRLAQQRDEQRDQLQQAQQRAEAAEQRAEDANQQLSELEERLGQMDREVEDAEQRIDEQRTELQQAQQRAERLEAELENAPSDHQADDQDDNERAEQLRERQRQLEDARAEAEAAQQQLEAAQAERDEFEQSRQQYEAQLEQARQEADEARAENERLADALEQREQTLADQEQALAERDEILQQREEAIEERDAEIERLKESARTVDPEAPEMAAVPVDPDAENAVRGVRLETGEDGRSQIVVELDRPSQFTAPDTEQEGRSVMVLNDVELPDELERTLSSDADGGAVRFVSSYEDDDGSVRMEADLRSDATEMIHQDGNNVVWEFAPEASERVAAPEHAEAGQPNADRQRFDEDANPQRPTEGDSVTSAPPRRGGQQVQVVANPTQVDTVPGMEGTTATVDFRNADIDNVLRMFAEETGVDIITAEGVSGEVTMRLRDVPMDQAFLTVLRSLRLGYELRGGVIRVAPQEVLHEEEQQRAEARARAQEVEPLEVFLLPINYADAGELTAQVEGLLSPRGSVSVDDRTNTLIITDLPDNLHSIRQLIETLDAQVPQVLIEARIVETNENFDREVGIQWGGDFSLSQGSGNPTGLVFPNVLGMSGGATDGEAPVEGTSENPNYAVNLPATAGTGQGGAMGLTMGSVGGAVNLNMRLSAMEDAGYAKIISAPRIMTLDNREATISQGTSIPISVVSAAGVQTIFVDATLDLTVTPHVTPDGNVRMAIEATKNEPDFQNTGAQGDPTIIQNQAETELLVDDGDTTVIGGIYTENTGESISAVPFLHRIPILGFLFQTHSETENRSELLIFITPRIVNRAEALGIMSTGGLEGGMPEPDGGQPGSVNR